MSETRSHVKTMAMPIARRSAGPSAQYDLFDVPVIVRLAGTNVQEGRAILKSSGLSLIQAEDLDDAAAKAVAAAGGASVRAGDEVRA